jgi:hypothetical protein
MRRNLVLIVLAAFAALTAAALWQTGILGIVDWHVKSFGGGQVFADLVIALTLAMVWMWHDAKARRRNPWPWLIITLVTGSFGPLLYLLTRKTSSSTT